ncbi:PWWP domain-containing DNA repair factor 3B-like [Lampris incognitus]|uniref:PWWP domain-containing DNA repair factor 3B-like n=1 Tax=Lampris incognitus TaxID=2546036 RepID=UPI0024B4BBD1|nr:PWWP domain-containing DNA repair factor 3B-like [Lampris incognitus]XP_056144628.1 PWWP domain-containing DNA repair factor 3B-like [Lampris incognitus]XP_056144629.1 PWWP domain-containing DNA repair factor 3B-like [Lampris incognitus]
MAKRAREARRSANERLVDFITKLKGSDKRLLEIITGEGSSKWLVNFRSAKPDRVFTYLEEDDQIDEVFKDINLVFKGATKCAPYVPTTEFQRVSFVLDVLMPEAIVHALVAVENLSLAEAQRRFNAGPLYDESEVQEFNDIIKMQKRQ